MKNKKVIAIVVLVVGIVILGLSLAADAIGIGGSAATGFGPRQIAGSVVGVIAVIVGLFLMLKK